MTLRIRCVGDTDMPIRFFNRFTIPDMGRLGIPTAIGGVLAGLPGAIIGLLVGVVWYAFRPYGRPIDGHAYHVARQTGRRVRFAPDRVGECIDDHAVTKSGAVVGVVRIRPTNLRMKGEAKQRALHTTYRELLATTSFPLTVQSRQLPLSLERYADRVDSEDNRTAHEYAQYCRSLSDGDIYTTHHYVPVRVSGHDDRETALTELDARCDMVVDALSVGELEAERVTGMELQHLVQSFDVDQVAFDRHRYVIEDAERLGKYRRMAVVEEFPADVPLGWPVHVLQTDGMVDVLQTIEPEPPADVTKTLRRRVERLTAEIDSTLAAGYLGTNDLEKRLEDAEWMLNLLADRTDTPVTYRVAVVARGHTREECDRTFDRVCTQLDAQRIQYRIPVFQSDYAFRTDSPLTMDGFTHGVLMPARSAAAGFPAATHSRNEGNGVMYGVDARDRTPILLDRFAWPSHSMVRMGTVGSGKSYAAKLEILRARHVYDDLQVYIIDPKREYGGLVQALGGRVYTLGEDYPLGFKTADVIAYQVSERGQAENVDMLVDVVRDIYRYTSRIQRPTLVVIDEARILMNDDHGRQVLNQFVLEARDTNTGVTLISQNASHFTYCREGREILDNCPAKVFMKHERVPESVIKYFRLSTREQQALYELKTGTDRPYSQAIIKIGGRLDAKIRIEAAGPQEYAILTDGDA